MARLNRIYAYILFGVFASYCIFLIFFTSSSSSNDQEEVSSIPSNFTKPLPIVLTYNSFFGETFFDPAVVEEIKKCEYKCQYLEDKKFYPVADIAFFHARDVKMDSMLSSNRNPNRLNVLFSMEAEPNAKLSQNIPKNFFNITLTYRTDSTLWRPYDKFEEFSENEKDNEMLVWSNKEVDKMIAKKTKLALQFVSNCQTHSKREQYLSKLQKYANITVYGRCNRNPFRNNEEKVVKEFEKYFFYLAFENSVCDGYVTEKFWRLKQLIVPIVLKRSVLKGIADDEYFIAADDFQSPELLVQKLKYLSQNLQEYKKYFGWTKKYKKTKVPYPKLYNFCKLCEIATKKERHSINDIHKWWTQDSKCVPDFALKLIN